MKVYDRENYIKEGSILKKLLLKLFKSNDKLTVLDIGGCEGEESIRYSNLFPKSTIFIFEPLPANQMLINRNIIEHKKLNIKLIAKAVSDHDSLEKFYISSGQPNIENKLDWDFGNKSSSLLMPKIKNNPEWLKFKDEIMVNTITIHSFFEEYCIKIVDFAHIDVQGAELKVLYGAKKRLKNIKALWLEVADIELYKNQVLRPEIELFMRSNNFYLVKSEMTGKVGDQFYINKKYFHIFPFFNSGIFFKKKINVNN
jgi:FkbM family methyltransferase